MTCTLGSLSASIFGGSASIELLYLQRRLALVCIRSVTKILSLRLSKDTQKPNGYIFKEQTLQMDKARGKSGRSPT
jgi:hypothetical protein